MRAAGIVDVSRRRGISTTRRDRNARPTPDLVARNFTADRPNQLWVADITYVPTEARFLYLAVVLDVFGAPQGTPLSSAELLPSPRPWHVAPLSARRTTTTRAQDSVKVHPFTVRFSRVRRPLRSFVTGPGMRINGHRRRPRPAPAAAHRRIQMDRARAMPPAAPGFRMAVPGATEAPWSDSGPRLRRPRELQRRP
jgi:hypothetical protein